MVLRVAVIVAALAGLSVDAWAQSAANVLVVINDTSNDSKEIGAYYAKVRKLPETHVVHIQAPTTDSVTREFYDAAIQRPIAGALAKYLLQDQILYIVLTKGVPFRIDGTGGQDGTVASVDSELTLLYRRMTLVRPQVTGRIDNPYFLGNKPLSDAKRFTHVTSDIYLVSRLDGFTVADVKALIDRGLTPAREGQIVLDQRATSVDYGGDAWLAETAKRLTAANKPFALESTRAIAKADGPVLGYFSWGSNDPSNQLRKTGLTFANGAIGGTFVSTDGRTFREPTAEWRPAPAGATTGGQSLAADLIRDGLTGVTAHVAEPFLDAVARPQILFPAYLAGFGLVESYYLAIPFVSWQNVVIGDPLVAPFQTTPLADAEFHHGVDDKLALPRLFGQRLLAVLTANGSNAEAMALSARVDSLTAQGKPEDEMIPLLEQATAIERRLFGAQFRLATTYQARGDFDAAMMRYRAILEFDPDNIVVLNNLAYILVERKDLPKEALPLSQRAYNLSVKMAGGLMVVDNLANTLGDWKGHAQLAAIADTLGWVHHKLGDHATGLTFIERAAKAFPENGDIQIHAAFVHAAMGNLPAARTYLDAALKLDPKLGDPDDVKALIAKIKSPADRGNLSPSWMTLDSKGRRGSRDIVL